jgi:hypothetical protein
MNKKLALLTLSVIFIIALSSLIIAEKTIEELKDKTKANETLKKEYVESKDATYVKDVTKDHKIKNTNIMVLEVIKDNKQYKLITNTKRVTKWQMMNIKSK